MSDTIRQILLAGKEMKDDKIVDSDISFEVISNGKTSGYGMPISRAVCRKMVDDYHHHQMKLHNKLSELNTVGIDEIKQSIDVNYEVVSGIYGRDTLLHILQQEGCEGVMYIYCRFEDKNSIVIFGVDAEGKPVGEENTLNKDDGPNPVIYEVKGDGKTRAQVLDFIKKREEQGIVNDKKGLTLAAILD